jgi:hypothetical protein
MLTISKFALPLIALACAPIAFAQTVTQPSPQLLAPDIGKILAQTFSEQDIELVTRALRDGLQGKAVDERRMAPLAQKMEGLAAVLMREMLTQSVPMIDGLEGELKKELRRLKEAKPQ